MTPPAMAGVPGVLVGVTVKVGVMVMMGGAGVSDAGTPVKVTRAAFSPPPGRVGASTDVSEGTGVLVTMMKAGVAVT